MESKYQEEHLAGRTNGDSSNDDLRRRLGAVSFVENVDIERDDSETPSLHSLRDALLELEQKEHVLARTVPELQASEGEEELSGVEKIVPEYSETFNEETEDAAFERPRDSIAVFDEETTLVPTPRSIVEAMLFVGDRNNRPLSPVRAAEKMRNVSPEEIDAIVTSLNEHYQSLGCPYTIRKEKDGYRMVLKPDFEPVLTRFQGRIREARLSQQAIDTLAVVAYRQPITAEDVHKIRKQPSSAPLSQLVRRGLLEAEREIRDKKKVVFYRTTDRFLDLFQLESLEDLPVSEELDFR